MNRPEIYQKSMDVLVKAYIDGGLDRMDCAACAVGNLVAAGCGYTRSPKKHKFLDSEGRIVTSYWSVIINSADGLHFIPSDVYKQITCTGYNRRELHKIEEAFMHPPESGNFGYCVQYDEQYHGLIAVLKVLDEIHEVKDDTIKASSKVRFDSVRETILQTNS